MTPIIELRSGDSVARIAPTHGARITQARLSGVEVLHPYPEDATTLLPWAKGGLYPLAPYSGRIAHARLVHNGRTCRLAPHPDGLGHTMHGTAHQKVWEVRSHRVDQAELEYLHEPDSHWPWRFHARMSVILLSRAIKVRLSLSNLDTETMPAGIGLHPFLPYTPGSEITYRAGATWQHTDAIPFARGPNAIQPHRLEAETLDTGSFTSMQDGWEGNLVLAGTRHAIRIQTDETLRHLVIHKPLGGSYVCVEPVSHVADGFNLHARGIATTGVRFLREAECLSGQMQILL